MVEDLTRRRREEMCQSTTGCLAHLVERPPEEKAEGTVFNSLSSHRYFLLSPTAPLSSIQRLFPSGRLNKAWPQPLSTNRVSERNHTALGGSREREDLASRGPGTAGRPCTEGAGAGGQRGERGIDSVRNLSFCLRIRLAEAPLSCATHE